MKITQVTVSAGRTIPHPIHEYSNLRHHVSITADIESDDDPEQVIIILQAKTEQLVETHSNILDQAIHARILKQNETNKPQDLLEFLNQGRKKWNQLQREEVRQFNDNPHALCSCCGELLSICQCERKVEDAP